MFKSLFGSGKKRAKSVQDIRARGTRSGGDGTVQEQRIRAKRQKNIRTAEIAAAIDAAGPFARPDISALVDEARAAHKTRTPDEAKAIVDRALRLKGAAGIVDETLHHPARRHIGLAVIRGLLEQGPDADQSGETGQKAAEKSGKPGKEGRIALDGE